MEERRSPAFLLVVLVAHVGDFLELLFRLGAVGVVNEVLEAPEAQAERSQAVLEVADDIREDLAPMTRRNKERLGGERYKERGWETYLPCLGESVGVAKREAAKQSD